jgi:uroporphyrinogen-III synthase
MSDRPAVAVFRPDDERLDAAETVLAEAGVRPVADPMLAVDPTGATPADGADVVLFTSKTGVELVDDAGWEPGDGSADVGTGSEGAGADPEIAAIGAATADALRAAGYPVDLVPEEYTSAGLVAALSPRIERGAVESIEVARSDHGSEVLLKGLREAGASVHETVLYELRRPPDAGESTELAAAGELAGACFTSSLTVEHFLAAAAERGIEDAARAGLADAVVGAIGEPTAATLRESGIDVDVVPAAADVDELVTDVVAAIEA